MKFLKTLGPDQNAPKELSDKYLNNLSFHLYLFDALLH